MGVFGVQGITHVLRRHSLWCEASMRRVLIDGVMGRRGWKEMESRIVSKVGGGKQKGTGLI